MARGTGPKKKRKQVMKGMTISGGQKRPTKQGAGLTAAGVRKFRKDNPGSKLQTAVTGKLKKVVKLLKGERVTVQDLQDK